MRSKTRRGRGGTIETGAVPHAKGRLISNVAAMAGAFGLWGSNLPEQRAMTTSGRRPPVLRGTSRPVARSGPRLLLLLAVLLLAALSGRNALAQEIGPSATAPTIDRDRVDRQEPAIPRPPRVAPLPAPRPPVIEGQAAGGAGAVMLARVRYVGASVPQAALDKAVAPFIGRPLSRDLLQRVANAVSTVYAESGVAFYSVTVPRQVFRGGEVVVQVREGRIAAYRLRKTTRSTPTRLIAAYMDRLMRGRPTHKAELERALSLLRDVPGQTVDAQLRTTARPDELLLDLDVKRKQVDVSLDFDNDGVTNVVRGVQAQLSVSVHGLLREGDSTRASAYLPFQPDRYQFYSLTHSTPLDANGTRLSLSAAHVRTRTEGTEIRGEATQAGIGVSVPVIRSYRRNLSLSLSLDGIDSENYFLDTAFGGFRTRVVRASATWSSIGAKGRGGYAIAGTLSRGLNALGARPFVGYSDTAFTKANLQLTAVEPLGKAVSVKVTGRGQYTDARLPTTERFSLGGEGAGLAFRLGEITAERAVAGSAELSWRLAGGDAKDAAGLTAFAYADGALARSLARPRFNLPRQDYSLASAGGGVRVALGSWTATAQIAVPVKRPGAFAESKARFLFSIGRRV